MKRQLLLLFCLTLTGLSSAHNVAKPIQGQNKADGSTNHAGATALLTESADGLHEVVVYLSGSLLNSRVILHRFEGRKRISGEKLVPSAAENAVAYRFRVPQAQVSHSWLQLAPAKGHTNRLPISTIYRVKPE